MRGFRLVTGPSGPQAELQSYPTPDPQPREILVAVRTAALNRGELLNLRADPSAGPAGYECAGEIVRLGADVTGFAIGDRVMGFCRGGFADFAVMAEGDAMHVPDGLSWEQAATVPAVFTVAHDMVIAQGHLSAGDWLLVLGASSGVGVAAIQTAKALGAKVIGTSGSPNKLERLEALGLDFGICSRTDDFCDTVMQVTGDRGVNLVVNNVGGSVFVAAIRALAFEGRLALVGQLDGVSTSLLELGVVHRKRLCVFGVSNYLRSAEQRAASNRAFARDVLPFIESGKIGPHVDKVFDLDDLQQAIDFMRSDNHLGKIAVRVS